jgi:hypothetical protein
MRFLAYLELVNKDWQLADLDATSIERSKSALNARKVVDIWHNNVE